MTCPRNEMNPAATAMADGVRGAHLDRKLPSCSTLNRAVKANLKVKVSDDEPVLEVDGRKAQTLSLLNAKGDQGFTSGDASPLGWARRTSAYVRKLRRSGVPILTTWETTPDGSRIGRYTLQAPVTVVQKEGGS